jgi:DUF1680 family protein
MKAYKSVLSLSFIVIFFTIANIVFCQSPGQFSDKFKMQVKIPVKALSFDLKDVRLLDGPFLDNMERNGKWLLSIDSKRLLHNYRVNAGIRTGAKALGGWEMLDVELRGHTLGHVLSGLAMMYASTGDEAYKKKGDSLVVALAECQKVLGRDGYISAYPENFIDRVIAGQPVWAPWYTLHKIYAGLLDMYLYADNAMALDILSKAAGWAYKKIGGLDDGQLAKMQRTEFGGMSEVFYNLYAVTGNPDHKKLAECFYHHAVFDPLAEGTDRLNRLHANTQIPKITGEARAYELTGNENSKKIAEYFWRTVIDNHTYANGGNSDGEHFFEPGKLSEHMSVVTTETCNTYNMLKLTRHLFEWTGDPEYADYYEKALYNHILGSQDPESGMVCYFTPLAPGHFKVYSTPYNSFWCCVGTGFESHAKYAESIYYHNDESLFVNLFIPSVVTWKEKGLTLRQETRYPETDNTSLIIVTAPSSALSVYVRHPSWAVSGASVKLNGKKVSAVSKPGSYIIITRKWKTGDRIDITLPMSLRFIAANDNPDLAAVAYGPVLLAGAMGKEGVPLQAPYGSDQNDYDEYPVPAGLIHELKKMKGGINEMLKPVAGENLTFITTPGVATSGVRLIPFYKLHHQRYVVYWDLK